MAPNGNGGVHYNFINSTRFSVLSGQIMDSGLMVWFRIFEFYMHQGFKLVN